MCLSSSNCGCGEERVVFGGSGGLRGGGGIEYGCGWTIGVCVMDGVYLHQG